MTDYAEEQRNELEAIESIYPDSFTVLSDDPTSFTITVTSDAGENGETVEATLKFTYVEKYPDEPPLWEIHSQENLEDSDVEDILTLLQQQAEENLGMVMIFTLVTAVQEKLNEIVDVMKNRQEEEKLRKEKEAEEAEKVAFQGTVVTIENFLAWKAKFELEMAELRRKKQKEEEQAGKPKLTESFPHQVNSCLRETTTWTHLIFSSLKTLETMLKWMSHCSRTLRIWTWMRTTKTLTL
ncbi:RWD domain-containing protein 1 isoform X2 [Siniperca chuatsi]|uniref:RWD domain-containing protein 1 isoform X2 n=1 Tax=Siniperca chuatsi TaxID=119488 RepID=UPI001CE204E2|nr:RWD domain-containing protein 1 isoform X2 [Siniperca chuatsi]